MKQQSKKIQTFFIKSFFILLAVNFIGISVALILESQLGCDPIGILCDGIAHSLSISFGLGSFLYNIGIIGVALLVARKKLGIGTVVYGLLSGFFIDFYREIFEQLSLAGRGIFTVIIVFAIGEILMAGAFALLMGLQLGMTALDAFLMKVQEKTSISYAFLKIGMDICFVIAGAIMGGTFGIGTIVSAMVTGVLVAKWAKAILWMKDRIQGDIEIGGCQRYEEV